MQYADLLRVRADKHVSANMPPPNFSAHRLIGSVLLGVCMANSPAQAAGTEDELLRQRERERALQEQLETRPDVRLQVPAAEESTLPATESPCFRITEIRLIGDAAERFQWALGAANPDGDPAIGRCLGAGGVNLTMKRIQNAIIARGYVTTRVLAEAQDLSSGILVLTVIPGRVGKIMFAEGTSARANARNAMPAASGDLLNLRDIEQALENFKRVPTAEADIQITPTTAVDAPPGESDLLVTWTQKLPARISFSIDNSGSKGTGKYQGNIALSLDNPLSLNDVFYASLTHHLGDGESGSHGSKGNTLNYSLPLGYWVLGLTNSEYDYHQTVAGTNVPYRYLGESRTNELRLSRLVYRDAQRK